MIRSNYAVF